ncbi:pseudouridylate synthase 7 homolog isoform X2 [Homarus americanus]|uniref:pseudouridylate synthase 7 homolog isoform X2 n=1 Tax=Homarus americanus TaxID=6706 RepID=UPI001C457A35|nr:pseudouridylate synthase 7 homolog isoform X2 [Homarus americanus]
MEEEGSVQPIQQDESLDDEDFAKTMEVEEEDGDNCEGNDAIEEVDSDDPGSNDGHSDGEGGQEGQEGAPAEVASQDKVKDNADNGAEEPADNAKSDEKDKEVEKGDAKKSIEKDVGITQYAGDHKGFFGIIKQKYSDFLVNEVNSAGEIVCITEQMVPHEPEEIPAEPLELPPELTPEKISELNRLVGIKEPVRLPLVPPPKKDTQVEDSTTLSEKGEKKEEEKPEGEKEEKPEGEEEEEKPEGEKEKEEKPEGEKEEEKPEGEKEEEEECEVKKEEGEEASEQKEQEEMEDKEKKEVFNKDVKKENDDIEEMEEDDDDEDDDGDDEGKESEQTIVKEEDEQEEEEAPETTEEAVETKEEEKEVKKMKKEEESNNGDQTGVNRRNTRTFNKRSDPDAPKEVMIDVNNTDKEGRTAIHRAVKAKFRVVDSIFKEMKDGGRYIVVRKKKAGSVRRERTTWPKSQMYTTFVLYKENIDTMEAINHIAWKTRVKPNNFSYAGTKDKRAKSSQLVSVSRVAPHKLWHATKNHRGIQLGNFRFRPTPQKLGQLRGNHFRVILREVKGEDEVINSAIESLKSTGFINYYGTQRFGTSNIHTHVIGRELLKSNWQQAVNLILAPRENDIPEVNRCRTTWKETGDAEAALKSLPKRWESSIEAQLLTGLVQLQRNDLVGALDRIPRNTRLLYLHAYQSYLWNTVASRRIEKYGLKVLPGDLVRRKENRAEEEELPVSTPFSNEGSNCEKVGTHWWNAEVTKAVQEKKEAYYLKMQTEGVSEEEQKERQKRYQEAKQKAKRVVRESKRKAEEELGKYWAKLQTLPPEAVEDESNDSHNSDGENADQEAKAEIEGEEANGHKIPDLHFLTEEEAKTADILDVLLPLPGYNVEYPDNEIKEWYKELLETDGLSFSSLKHRVKSYAVGGAYRRLIVRPTNVNGTLCYYKDSSKPLIQSDMDKLREVEVKDNILTEGPHKAVILEMTLPASSYATVALRELLKMDTSSQFQATLNPQTNYTHRNRDFSSRRGMPRGRGGPWRGPDRRGGWEERGSWKHQGFRGSWRGHDNSGSSWRQGRGGGGGGGSGRGGSFKSRGDYGDYRDHGDYGGYRGGQDYGWNSSRGGGRGGYGGGGGWGGRGEKRSRRGGDNWNAKRGRYY